MIKSFKLFSKKQNLNEEKEESETSYFNTSDNTLKNIIFFDEDNIVLQQIYSKEIKVPISASIDYVKLGFENYKKVREEIIPIITSHRDEIRKILSVADSLIVSQILLLKNELEEKASEYSN